MILSEAECRKSATSIDERTVTRLAGRGESNSNQSVSNNSVTQVELDAVDFEDSDTVLDVDTANNRIRVKKAGVISIIANLAWSEVMGDGTRGLAQLEINGTSVARQSVTAGGNAVIELSVSDVKDLNVDDDITLNAFQNSGSAKSLTGNEFTSLAAIHEG